MVIILVKVILDNLLYFFILKKYLPIIFFLMNTVSIMWIKGSFHEEAAKQFFTGDDIDIVENKTFEDLIESVVYDKSDFWVIAVENSVAGTIHKNLNLLRESKVKIVGETFLRVKQNLAVCKGATINSLTQVMSHHMALKQTEGFFKRYPNIKLIEESNTAVAMKKVAEMKDPTVWAIGSVLAAEMNGLEIIGEWIETNKQNYTRFCIIKPEFCDIPTSFNKATLSFVLYDEPGALAKIISMMAFYDVNLTKLESVPIMGKPFEYRFYIDVTFDDLWKYEWMLTAIRPLLLSIDELWRYQEDQASWKKIHTQQE